MSIYTNYSHKDNSLTIHIDHDFDNSVLDDFVEAYKVNTNKPKIYYIDLQKVDYIDSEMVGPLVEFCKFINSFGADAYVINMNDTICEEFRVLNLHKLFKPEFSRQKFGIDWVYHGIEK